MSHHHTYYVTSSYTGLASTVDLLFIDTSSYILCHIIIHTMSHHHTQASRALWTCSSSTHRTYTRTQVFAQLIATGECVLLLQNVFSYYRMCSLTPECVLLLQNVFSYSRMCSFTPECVPLTRTHTVRELAAWAPLLSATAAIVLHDTNLPHSCTYARKDGSTGEGWDNERGVIRAVQEFVNVSFGN